MRAATDATAVPVSPGSPRHGFGDLRLLDSAGPVSLYAARELETGRAVSLKVLDEHAPDFVREALDREADRLALVDTHPHVVTFYRHATLDDGRRALVLEASTGSAAAAAHAGQLSVPVAVAIGLKVAGALETVHRAGLVHCAVQPRSILLSEFDEPLLADFGAAVAVGQSTVVAVHETGPHLAPELLLGDAPTPATDVYELSATLYELLAGRAAFRAYDGESPAAISLRILAGGVRPLVAPEIPLELSDLLVWGMSADPAERPPGAAWLAEELSRLEHKQGWPRTRVVTGEPRPNERTRRRFFLS